MIAGEESVARLDSDNFVVTVAVPGSNRAEHARGHAERLIAALQDEPYDIDGDTVLAEVRAGVVVCPDHGETADTLLANAELAWRKAREARTAHAMYDPSVDRVSRRLCSASCERRSPPVSSYSTTSRRSTSSDGAVRSVEALVRWNHPTRGLLYPDAFIEAAEKSHLIRDLTWNVLDQAMRQARIWLDEGQHIAVAVNMSALHLSEQTLPDQVQEALDRADVPASLLILEMTEGSLMKDPEGTIEVLQRLRDLGVRIAMDDYGTGYSSLSKLTALPVGRAQNRPMLHRHDRVQPGQRHHRRSRLSSSRTPSA